MDFRLQTTTGAPCLNLNLVIARFGWEPDEAVAFDTVTAPGINRVDLEKEIWSFRNFIILSQKLEVNREREMADILCSFNMIIATNKFNRGFTRMGD